MRSQLLHDADGARTFAVVLETGDKVMECLQNFAREQGLGAAQITGIGAFSEVELNYFEWEKKAYESIPVREQVEVASLIGDIAESSEGPALHIHLVLGRRDGSALAGHLAEGRVRPTLELVINEAPAHLRRVHDPETGLSLIRPRS